MTSTTSINVYHEEIKGRKENSQDKIVLQTIQKLGTCTGRQIQESTGLEINVISRSLNNLWTGKRNNNVPLIEKYFAAKCPLTGRKVFHFRVVPQGVQTKLF